MFNKIINQQKEDFQNDAIYLDFFAEVSRLVERKKFIRAFENLASYFILLLRSDRDVDLDLETMAKIVSDMKNIFEGFRLNSDHFNSKRFSEMKNYFSEKLQDIADQVYYSVSFLAEIFSLKMDLFAGDKLSADILKANIVEIFREFSKEDLLSELVLGEDYEQNDYPQGLYKAYLEPLFNDVLAMFSENQPEFKLELKSQIIDRLKDSYVANLQQKFTFVLASLEKDINYQDIDKILKLFWELKNFQSEEENEQQAEKIYSLIKNIDLQGRDVMFLDEYMQHFLEKADIEEKDYYNNFMAMNVALFDTEKSIKYARKVQDPEIRSIVILNIDQSYLDNNALTHLIVAFNDGSIFDSDPELARNTKIAFLLYCRRYLKNIVSENSRQCELLQKEFLYKINQLKDETLRLQIQLIYGIHYPYNTTPEEFFSIVDKLADDDYYFKEIFIFLNNYLTVALFQRDETKLIKIMVLGKYYLNKFIKQFFSLSLDKQALFLSLEEKIGKIFSSKNKDWNELYAFSEMINNLALKNKNFVSDIMEMKFKFFKKQQKEAGKKKKTKSRDLKQLIIESMGYNFSEAEKNELRKIKENKEYISAKIS